MLATVKQPLLRSTSPRAPRSGLRELCSVASPVMRSAVLLLPLMLDDASNCDGLSEASSRGRASGAMLLFRCFARAALPEEHSNQLKGVGPISMTTSLRCVLSMALVALLMVRGGLGRSNLCCFALHAASFDLPMQHVPPGGERKGTQ